MINSIRSFFDSKLSASETEADEASRIDRTNLASAALLIEVMKSDHSFDVREKEEFLVVLQQSLGVSEEDLNTISELAEEEASNATSLYQFTKLINDHRDYAGKIALIENMWRIAYSDEVLDRYEDHLIRKVAELLYVSHSDFIMTKLKVRDSKGLA